MLMQQNIAYSYSSVIMIKNMRSQSDYLKRLKLHLDSTLSQNVVGLNLTKNTTDCISYLDTTLVKVGKSLF